MDELLEEAETPPGQQAAEPQVETIDSVIEWDRVALAWLTLTRHLKTKDPT